MGDAKELLWSGLSSCRVHSSIPSFLYICASVNDGPELGLSGFIGAACISQWKQKAVKSHVICWTAQVSSEARPALEASDWRIFAVSQHAAGLTAGPFSLIFHVGRSSFHRSLRIWFTVLTATSITQSRVVFTHPPRLHFNCWTIFFCVCGWYLVYC